MKKHKTHTNPDKKKYDYQNENDCLSTKGSWINEHTEEFKKKADYIREHGMFDDFMTVRLTESGLSLIINQELRPDLGEGEHSYALSCMSHGKQIPTESVKRRCVVALLKHFLNEIESGCGYFGEDDNEASSK